MKQFFFFLILTIYYSTFSQSHYIQHKKNDEKYIEFNVDSFPFLFDTTSTKFVKIKFVLDTVKLNHDILANTYFDGFLINDFSIDFSKMKYKEREKHIHKTKIIKMDDTQYYGYGYPEIKIHQTFSTDFEAYIVVSYYIHKQNKSYIHGKNNSFITRSFLINYLKENRDLRRKICNAIQTVTNDFIKTQLCLQDSAINLKPIESHQKLTFRKTDLSLKSKDGHLLWWEDSSSAYGISFYQDKYIFHTKSSHNHHTNFNVFNHIDNAFKNSNFHKKIKEQSFHIDSIYSFKLSSFIQFYDGVFEGKAIIQLYENGVLHEYGSLFLDNYFNNKPKVCEKINLYLKQCLDEFTLNRLNNNSFFLEEFSEVENIYFVSRENEVENFEQKLILNDTTISLYNGGDYQENFIKVLERQVRKFKKLVHSPKARLTYIDCECYVLGKTFILTDKHNNYLGTYEYGDNFLYSFSVDKEKKRLIDNGSMSNDQIRLFTKIEKRFHQYHK